MNARTPSLPPRALRRAVAVPFALLAATFLAGACSTEDSETDSPDADVPQRPAITAVGPDTVISADGIPIVYEVEGGGEAVVVLVHGWATDRGYWDSQVDALAGDYRVVSLDLPGHGQSGVGRETWTVPAFGADVAAVVDAVGPGPVVLVGHSLGGPIAVEAAGRLGERVAGVIGIDTFNDMDQEIDRAAISGFLDPFRADFRTHAAAWVAAALFPESADQELRERVAADMASAPPDISVAMLERYFDWVIDGADAALRALDVPVISINSDLYPTNPEAMEKRVDGYELHIIEGVGHYPMLEAPGRFNPLLRGAVETLLAAGAGDTG